MGILNTTGVQSFVVASDSGNGGVIAYSDIIKMLEDVNADQLGDPAWITTPAIKADLKLLTRLANTIALPVLADDETLAGYEARSTNQVPKTERPRIDEQQPCADRRRLGDASDRDVGKRIRWRR